MVKGSSEILRFQKTRFWRPCTAFIIRQSRIQFIVYILVNIWIFFIIENYYILYNMRSLQNCNKKDDYMIYHKKSHLCSWDFHINGTIFSPNCRITAESRILTAEHPKPYFLLSTMISPGSWAEPAIVVSSRSNHNNRKQKRRFIS